MSPEDKPVRSVPVGDLEAVIRRAVELAQVQVDSEERVSEAELIRIGSEIGLSADKVRQALYDQPQLVADAKWYDQYFVTPVVAASRVVPTRQEVTLGRMEEYICSSEYMQIVRRKQGELRFIPAEDAISRLARGFSRPSGRFHIAHARRLVVNVQPIGEDRTHIRVESDFSEQRAKLVNEGLIAGGFLGFLPGVVTGGLMAAGLHNSIGTVGAIAAGFASLGISTAAGSTIGFRIAANKFRNRMADARREIENLLDRAEHSDKLEPPPAPWRRSLRAKFFGTG